jgi:hypothetical protein
MQFVMTDECKIQKNSVERSTLWHGLLAYENGRVKRFKTEREAWEFLTRCDAADKIIH